MRIIIVRHGDPNYELDTLTKIGWREAELAAEYLSKLQIKAFYVSPLGRGQTGLKWRKIVKITCRNMSHYVTI